MAVSVTVYILFATPTEGIETYVTGFVFTILTTILLGISVVVILIIRGRQILRVWILIGTSFLINSITDVHYYVTENFTDWSISSYENIFWFIAQIVLFYALIEHKKMYRVLQE